MARGIRFPGAITGQPLHRCMRCDAERHVNELGWQNGLLLCMDTCFDNPDTWTRDGLIQEMLTDNADEAQVAEILRGDSNEPEPPQP